MSKINSFLRVIALRGTVKILEELSRRKELTYSELRNVVGHPSTTSRALKALMEFKVVKRRVLDESYRPVVYSLTDKGEKLASIIKSILELE